MKISIHPTPEATVEVEAFETSHPELAIHEISVRPGPSAATEGEASEIGAEVGKVWAVSHVPSGDLVIYGLLTKDLAIAAADEHIGDGFAESGALGNGAQVILSLGASDADQVGFGKPRRKLEHRLGDADVVVIAERAQNIGRRIGPRRNPPGKRHAVLAREGRFPSRHFAGDLSRLAPAGHRRRASSFARPQAENTRLRSPETQSRRKIKKQGGRCARAALA